MEEENTRKRKIGEIQQEEKKDWEKTPRENEHFFLYYSQVGIIPEGEWEEFEKINRVSLPTSFRLNPTCPFFQFIQKKLQDYGETIKTIEHEGEKCDPPSVVSWYPDQLAWHFNISRGPLRKSPEFQEFHNMIITTSDYGGLTRQEVVSMIPPLMLDVEPHHMVLDMCAAPGSKTSQILDIMRSKCGVMKYPTGVVIANDVDEKRLYMLIHQLNRISTPSFMVTNHEAQSFPSIPIPHPADDDQSNSDSSSNNNSNNNERSKTIRFDRVLADVPCSGDGTLRKNYDLWGRWNPAIGLGLHHVQVKIALRSAELLKVGGRMVYSTCSYNPIEDEAVVAELLRRCKGSMVLVDVSDQIPQLKRLQGVTHWRVYDKDKVWYDRHEDLPHYRKSKIAKSSFPPTAEEIAQFNLHRCMRILPHHQNTGGFFVSVLEKISEVVLGGEEEEEKKTSTVVKKPEKKKKNNQRNRKEAPYFPLTSDRWKSTLQNVSDYYKFDETFAKEQLFVRSEGNCPRIYFVSPSARFIYEANAANPSLQLINMGVRMFGSHSFQDAACPYRLNLDGLYCLVPYLHARKVQISPKELNLLLIEKFPFFTQFSEAAQETFLSMDIGGVYFEITFPELSHPILLPGWRGKVSSHFLLSDIDKKFLRLTFLSAEEKEKAIENDKIDRQKFE